MSGSVEHFILYSVLSLRSLHLGGHSCPVNVLYGLGLRALFSEN